MKQIEDALAVLAIGHVERLDSCARVDEHSSITWLRAFSCVMKIRQQGKEQIRIAITEIANLQSLEKIIDLLRPAQQGRDNHHGAVRRRNATRKIQAWQRARPQEERDQQVYQRGGQR